MNEVWNENYFLQYVSYDWLLCHRHANVYREWQNDGELNYNISAKAENCHLLPVERQTFIILRAGAKGKGMSMGQSSI